MTKKKVETLEVGESTSLSVALAETLSGDAEVTTTTDDAEETDDEVKEDTTHDDSEEHTNVVVCENDPELFFFENRNITTSIAFDPEGSQKDDDSFPVRGKGQIDNILVQADSDTFSVTLKVDDDELIDNRNWSYLNSISQELAHIGAYQKSSGEYVLSISDYPFKNEVKFSILPTQETTFELIRAELMIE